MKKKETSSFPLSWAHILFSPDLCLRYLELVESNDIDLKSDVSGSNPCLFLCDLGKVT